MMWFYQFRFIRKMYFSLLRILLFKVLLEHISLKWRRHDCAWTAAKYKAYTRNLWPLSSEGSLFIMPQLLWLKASVFAVSSRKLSLSLLIWTYQWCFSFNSQFRFTWLIFLNMLTLVLTDCFPKINIVSCILRNILN